MNKKPYQDKRIDYTTVLCFLRPFRNAYTPKDMHIIGKSVADIYRQETGKLPQTVEQVEGRRCIPVNLYPYRFRHTIKRVVEEYMKMKQETKREKSKNF